MVSSQLCPGMVGLGWRVVILLIFFNLGSYLNFWDLLPSSPLSCFILCNEPAVFTHYISYLFFWLRQHLHYPLNCLCQTYVFFFQHICFLFSPQIITVTQSCSKKKYVVCASLEAISKNKIYNKRQKNGGDIFKPI